jgi:hypothetical protein
LSLKEEDLAVVLAQHAEGVLEGKLKSFYPGIVVEAENSSRQTKNRNPGPVVAVNNNEDKPPAAMMMTNDDFLKMLG